MEFLQRRRLMFRLRQQKTAWLSRNLREMKIKRRREYIILIYKGENKMYIFNIRIIIREWRWRYLESLRFVADSIKGIILSSISREIVQTLKATDEWSLKKHVAVRRNPQTYFLCKVKSILKDCKKLTFGRIQKLLANGFFQFNGQLRNGNLSFINN